MVIIIDCPFNFECVRFHYWINRGQVIPDAVAVMFILNEIVSLSENSAKLGVAIPEPIQRALAIFQKKAEGKGDK